jgi:plasmid stabilization system protein ParE
VKLRYLNRAQRQLDAVLQYLHENGGLPSFRAELRRKTDALKVTPYIGAPLPGTRTPGVRVAYLETKHVLYYRVNEKAGFGGAARVAHESRQEAEAVTTSVKRR